MDGSRKDEMKEERRQSQRSEVRDGMKKGRERAESETTDISGSTILTLRLQRTCSPLDSLSHCNLVCDC